MNNELLNNISKMLDEKLTPIYKEIEEIKLDMSELKSQINNDCKYKITKDLDYIKGYYYNRTQ